MNDDLSSGTAQPVTLHGAPVLARPCAPVRHFDARLRALVANMFASMYAARGVGIAANQIGVGLRVFTIDCHDDEGGRVVGHVVNPVYRVLDETRVEGGEGCLSLPGAHGTFSRPAVAEVTGVDVYGEPVRLEATGYAARCLQHETDHLDGKLFVTHLTPAERANALAQFEAHQAAAAAAAAPTINPFGTSPLGGQLGGPR